MSEETNVEAQAETTETIEVVEAPTETTEIDWKAQARKWESRAKAAKADTDDAQRWREFQESQKSENERVNDELARVKAEADAAKLELMRIQVAAQKGITGDAVKLLKASSIEELEAEADILVALMATSKQPNQPQPDVSQGRPIPSVGQITREQLAEMSTQEIMKAKADGRLTDLLGR